MAYSFANAAAGEGGFKSPTSVGAGVQVRDGEELQEIQTDQLGFLAINGEAKLRLLPTPWPEDNLPPPTSSLLSVASYRGFVAAAGPDVLVFATTENVRSSFRAQAEEPDGKIRSFKPEITIPQTRLNHVVFSSDESVLVVSNQDDGGLIAYQVNNLSNGNTDPALQISTEGTVVRALIGNPDLALTHLFAAVTADGILLIADLKAGEIISGPNGKALKSGVSCVCWSNRGKQLIAGLQDGTASQFKNNGELVMNIPKSTSIPADMHVSSISWLGDHSFFIIYTPNDVNNGIQPSEYYIVNREPQTNTYTFQKLPEVIPPFGVERTPPFHFISRLRNFPPHIQDMLILTASSGTELAILSKADQSLSADTNTFGSFTLTTIDEDARRAQLPLSNGLSDTSPTGMAIDLSSRDNVVNPITSDPEILETADPVPNVLVLNHEGILSSWWVIYNDSIRQKTIYPGLAAHGVSEQDQKTMSDTSQTLAQDSNKVNSSDTFREPSPFAKATMSNVASPSPTQSVFGQSSGEAFAKSSISGENKSSWTTTGFGSSSTGPAASSQPSFGSPAFGSTTAFGGRPSPFGQTSSLSNSAFGKPTAFGSNNTSGFGETQKTASPFGGQNATSTKSGFASYAGSHGFGSFGDTKKNEGSQSPFAKSNGVNAFSQFQSNNSFTSKPSPFGNLGNTTTTTSQLTPGKLDNFKIGSSFKGDGSAQDDLPKPKESNSFGFGSGLQNILNETKTSTSENKISPTRDEEAEMGDDDEVEESDKESTSESRPLFGGIPNEPSSNMPQTLITPPATFIQSKATPNPPLSNLFGRSPQQKDITPQQSTTPGWSFGHVPSTTPKETPSVAHTGFFGQIPNSTPISKSDSNKQQAQSDAGESTPKIKEEPASDEETLDLKDIPEAPLPPETISKPPYASENNSASSKNSKSPPDDDAPLPPDFVPANRSADITTSEQTLPSEGDEFSSDFEGSGEDVTQEMSPVEEPTEEQPEQFHTSPESSLQSGGRSDEMSPTGGLFAKVSTANTAQKSSRPLFGEVGTAPVFAPPKKPNSPRSPSPIRPVHPLEALRGESSRSVSAPAHPRGSITQRKTETSHSPLANEFARAREQELAKEQARNEADRQKRAQAEAAQLETLDDHEDERIQRELESPLSPRQTLDSFLPYQPQGPEDNGKSGVPAQIERLYQDINSMIFTLGINARSLSEFLQYQSEQEPDETWPEVLASESPMDAFHDDWVLGDIGRLHEGYEVLEKSLRQAQAGDFSSKSQSCIALYDHDLPYLRSKLLSIRKTIQKRVNSENAAMVSLSPEQASIQNDLRKSSASIMSKLVQLEDDVTILRAKLAEFEPLEDQNARKSRRGRATPQKKPTVEAVANTIAKMTTSAEKKSSDIDFLEAQFKKLNTFGSSINGSRATSLEPQGTPDRVRSAKMGATPGSKSNSVYHTPNSKFGGSVRSTPGNKGISRDGMMISLEEKERWQARARRRKIIMRTLKNVLEKQHGNPKKE